VLLDIYLNGRGGTDYMNLGEVMAPDEPHAPREPKPEAGADR
jgi:hypothetical protein